MHQIRFSRRGAHSPPQTPKCILRGAKSKEEGREEKGKERDAKEDRGKGRRKREKRKGSRLL